MHKRMPLHGDYDISGETINLIENLPSFMKELGTGFSYIENELV